jgi:hypothetical protein
MSQILRPAGLQRLRSLVSASGDGEALAALEELIRYAPAAAPGARSPATIAALAARDEALCTAAATFHLAPTELAAALARYAGTAWPRERDQARCPPRHHGKIEAHLWAALRAVPRAIGEKQIARILDGHELAVFMSVDSDQIAPRDQPDASFGDRRT